MYNLLKIIFIIILINIIFKLIIENFYNFENIPKIYESETDTIIDKTIPKIIHHICPRDFNKWHPTWLICYESWLRIFPKTEYTHMMWYDDELDKFIEKEFSWFLEIFKSYDVNIKRIDMVRPFFLYHYGGIYADMDYMVYKNFYNELPQDRVSICESPYKGNEEITNALMASPPKSIFWLLVIDECYKHRHENNILLATGPQLISNTHSKYPEFVNVLPWKTYNKPKWEPEVTEDTIAKHYNTVAW